MARAVVGAGSALACVTFPSIEAVANAVITLAYVPIRQTVGQGAGDCVRTKEKELFVYMCMRAFVGSLGRWLVGLFIG